MLVYSCGCSWEGGRQRMCCSGAHLHSAPVGATLVGGNSKGSMFPAEKGSWVEEEVHGIMAQLDGLIKSADEFFATDGPPGFDKDANNQIHGEYLGRLKVALENVRRCCGCSHG